MHNDYEELYMIRQGCEDAFLRVIKKFNLLLWKRSHDLFAIQKPQGIVSSDLYQEGSIGLFECVYAYKETMQVGFAFYVNLCVVSSIKTALRRCRGQSYRLLDSRLSFDMSISEDESLFLSDVIEDRSVHHNPALMSLYSEAEGILNKELQQFTLIEQQVYRLRSQGYSYQEISTMCKLTPKNVDNTIQKIRRKLGQTPYLN